MDVAVDLFHSVGIIQLSATKRDLCPRSGDSFSRPQSALMPIAVDDTVELNFAASNIPGNFRVQPHEPAAGNAAFRRECEIKQFAGMAIENSMLGAAHALANPLTANFGVPHGQAVGIMLPHVVRFNGSVAGKWYQELLQLAPAPLTATPRRPPEEHLARFLTEWISQAGITHCLSLCDIPRDGLSQLAQEAAGQWTAQFNPRPVDPDQLLQIYEQAYDVG